MPVPADFLHSKCNVIGIVGTYIYGQLLVYLPMTAYYVRIQLFLLAYNERCLPILCILIKGVAMCAVV